MADAKQTRIEPRSIRRLALIESLARRRDLVRRHHRLG